MDWFLYDNDLRHERVKVFHIIRLLKSYFFKILLLIHQTCIKISIIKPFDLVNTILLTRTQKLIYNNLLMRKF